MHTRHPLEPQSAQTPFASRHRSLGLITIACSALGVLLIGFRGAGTNSIEFQLAPSPTPLLDRLSTPVLPAAPTPIDLGRLVYYMNCMPCHGDRGQGLTDEWRATWVEDHQNCWARGCHAGREGDQGYPLPHTIPAIIGSPPILGHFQAPSDLVDYLHRTHPPQRSGALTVAEYQNVTAFMWWASDRSSVHADQSPRYVPIGLLILIGLVLALAIFVVFKRRRSRSI